MGVNIRCLCEPILFLYSFGLMLQNPTVHQFVYKRYSEDVGFQYSYTEQSVSCRNGTMGVTQNKLQQQVQFLTARFSVIFTLCSTGPSVIMCLFYGALSDIIGRRCLIIVVLLASLTESVIILCTMYFELPVSVIFIGNVCAGLGGGLNAMFMLIISYIADVTDRKDRSPRIGIVEACLFLGMTLSHFASGPLIHLFGFSCPQLIVACCHFTSLIYTTIMLKETRTKERDEGEKEREPIYHIFHEQPLNMWRVLVKDRPNRWLLYLAIGILVSGLAFVVSIHPSFTLYLLNRPYCWPALDIGYIMGVYFLVLSVGTVFGMKVLIKCIPEWLLAILGYLFSLASFLLLAFAKNSLYLYGAVVIRLFGGLPTAIFRGRISSSVEENEQGAIFSVVTSLETILIFFGTLGFNLSYSELNNNGHPGWFFFIPAILILLPLGLAVFYWKNYLARCVPPNETAKDSDPLLNTDNLDEEDL